MLSNLALQGNSSSQVLTSFFAVRHGWGLCQPPTCQDHCSPCTGFIVRWQEANHIRSQHFVCERGVLSQPRKLLQNGLQESITIAGDAAAKDNAFHVVGDDKLLEGKSKVAAYFSDYSLGDAIAFAGGLVDRFGCHRALLAQESTGRKLGCFFAHPSDSGSSGEGFKAATRPALAAGAVGVNHHVTYFAR